MPKRAAIEVFGPFIEFGWFDRVWLVRLSLVGSIGLILHIMIVQNVF